MFWEKICRCSKKKSRTLSVSTKTIKIACINQTLGLLLTDIAAEIPIDK